MKRLAVVAALVLAGCGADAPVAPAETVPLPTVEYVDPSYTDYEFPGANLYFICDGSLGVYVTEGNDGGGDHMRSSSVFVVPNHPKCGPA